MSPNLIIRKLFTAVAEGEYLTLKKLLSVYVNRKYIDARNDGDTLLMTAINLGHYKMVALLLHHRANPNLKNTYSYRDSALNIAIRHNYPQILALLLKNGARVELHDPSELMRLAINSGYLKPMLLLLRHGVNVNIRNAGGDTALLIAVLHDNYDAVKLLLRFGANVNDRDMHGKTPLHWAVSRRYESICKLLIEHGASIFAYDNEGRMPMDNMNSGLVEMILPYYVASNSTLTKCPLGEAARHGWSHGVRLLLDQGHQVDYRMTFGYTPLHEAANLGYTNVVDTLKTKVNEYNLNIVQEAVDSQWHFRDLVPHIASFL